MPSLVSPLSPSKYSEFRGVFVLIFLRVGIGMLSPSPTLSPTGFVRKFWGRRFWGKFSGHAGLRLYGSFALGSSESASSAVCRRETASLLGQEAVAALWKGDFLGR